MTTPKQQLKQHAAQHRKAVLRLIRQANESLTRILVQLSDAERQGGVKLIERTERQVINDASGPINWIAAAGRQNAIAETLENEATMLTGD